MQLLLDKKFVRNTSNLSQNHTPNSSSFYHFVES